MYESQIDYVIDPIKQIGLHDSQLSLSGRSLADLKEIMDIITFSPDLPDDRPELRAKANTFLMDFGSHVKRGPFVLGGVYHLNAKMSFQSETERDSVKAAVSESMSHHV